MYWGIIHRTIVWELLKIFVLALVAVTSMILLAGIVSEAMKNGFGPLQILAIIPLLLPSLLPYTVPTATLFTTCIVYGRLSADNEILALKAAGIHIARVIWPVALLGFVTSAATMFFYLDLIPYTGSLLRNNVVGDPQELLYAILRKEGQIKHPRIDWEINVKTMQGEKLQDVIFKKRKLGAPPGSFELLARAKEAELRWDSGRKKIRVHMRFCNVTGGNGGREEAFADSQIIDVDVPDEFFGVRHKFRAMDMTWDEMFEYLEKNRADIEKIDQDQAALLALAALGKVDPGAQDAVRNNDTTRELRMGQILAIHAEFHMRPALSLGCLCFALVGCPVGIWFSKSDYLSAFITCFLPIIVVYYPLMLCLSNMARSGKIPPWLGIYDADALMLLVGGYLFHRLTRN